jgi:hypothetical protein
LDEGCGFVVAGWVKDALCFFFLAELEVGKVLERGHDLLTSCRHSTTL